MKILLERIKLTKLAAQSLRNSLVNDFIEIKKNARKNDKYFTCPL